MSISIEGEAERLARKQADARGMTVEAYVNWLVDREIERSAASEEGTKDGHEE